MKRKTKFLAIALSSAMCLTSAVSLIGCSTSDGPVNPVEPTPSVSDADATLTIDGATKGTEISSDLFGIFLEDINYAGDALNAELVKNKSFGFASELDGWTDVGTGVSKTVVSGSGNGISSTNDEYLELSVTTAGGGVANSGFTDGLAVTKDATYDFSVYVRAENYSGGMTAQLTDGTNTYGSASISVTPSSEWVKYTATIKATDSCRKDLTLALTLDKAGDVDVDVVSLQPTDNIKGFRKDLAEALKDLSPHFVRFPGGCVIEGKTLSKAYDWKDSIGVDRESGEPVTITTKVVASDGSTSTETTTGADAVRTTGSDIWNYSTDYGVGFYEYFELCEYLGATAVPIVNCGIACMTQGNGRSGGSTTIGSDEFNYYLENAMDLVLFAKGSVTSSDPDEKYWAQVRTDMGHPEPFEMDYLGIGNEQWTNDYFEHFEAFRDAFIEASKTNSLYSSVELIVGNGCLFTDTEYGATPLAKSRMNIMRKQGYISKLSEYGMVDEHYYMNYTDFLDNTDHYDTYSREDVKRYDVFAGEYSANSSTDLNGTSFGVQFNSMATATAEAAYMTGIERNGDVVRLAAYAPVFGHINSSYNQWATDMIYYDNETYVPTCNYYVQQLFAKNQGTNILTSSLAYTTEELATFNISSKDKSVTKTEDSLYQVVSVDETGDIIIKIVNANKTEDITVAVDISGISFAGSADLYVLQSEAASAKNEKGDIVAKVENSSLTVNGTFAYTAKKNSVNVIRIHTK